MLIEAIVENKFMIIKGSVESLNLIKDILTFQLESAKFAFSYKYGNWDGNVKLYLQKPDRLIVRSGLVSFLKEHIPEGKFIDIRTYLPISDKEWDIGYEGKIKLRSYQEEAVLYCLKKQRGVVLVPTAGGKTYIAGGVLKAFSDYKCVYIVHRVVLMNQIKSELEAYLGESVGLVGGGLEELDKRVTVGMVQTLYSNGRVKSGYKDWMKEVKVVIVDECQHCPSKSYYSVIDMFEEAIVRIGLTGTLPEGELNRLKLRAILGDVVYEIDSKELSDEGYVMAPKVRMVYGEWPVNIREAFQSINWYGRRAQIEVWEKVRNQCLVNNEVRNQVIVDEVANYIGKGMDGILVVVDFIKHGQILEKMISAPFVWGSEGNRDTYFNGFKQGTIPVLICSPVLEEGIDVTGIKVVVLAGGGKSKVKLLQRIGRGMRMKKGKDSFEVVDFYDNEIPLLEKHSKARMKVYQTKGFDLEKVEV